MREMVGGCCVCSDEQGWNENPLVYCDGQGCTVAVHQACYGIVTVPTGPWYCRKCESQERAARVRCELCPSKDGALKRTDNGGWAHVVCALYIPEVRFGNVATMEPIILALVPQERYNKVCYLCLENSGRESKASHGACMQCNKSGCKDSFHVTCAQAHGLLCEEAGNYMDNVKYCGYCDHHFQRINKKLVKTIPAFRPAPNEDISPTASPEKQNNLGLKEAAKHLQASSTSKGKGKRGRKPGSMIYEPKLEPPKFNPDLASLSSSNNSLNNVGGVNNSVTLTPVTSSFSNSNHKSGTSFSNSETQQKPDKIFSEKIANNKTPNVVVKIGKHGEIYHAKKDSPHENNCVASPVERPGSSEAILERVTPSSNTNSIEVKEEASEKKGFTTANFTESFVTASVSVTAALIKSDSEKSPVPSEKVDTSKVKVELPDPADQPDPVVPVDPVDPVEPVEPVDPVESVSTVHSTATVSPISSTSGREPPPVSEAELPVSHPPVLTDPVSTSHQTIPQLKGDPKVTSASQSTGLTFSLEPQASVAPSIPTNSNSVSNMFNRTSLNNSVSLFPTSNTAAMAKSDAQLSQPHSSVSIIPSVTSNSSSLSSSSSSLTVTRTESSSPGGPFQSNNLGRASTTQPVTISPVTSDERLPLESPNQVKSGSMTMISPRSKAKAGNGPVKRIGRPPKKGTHTTNSSLGNVITVESEEDEGGGGASKRPRTDTTEKSEDTPKSEGTDNGLHRFMMFGATLNPTSGMAKEMNTVLQNEVAAHSVYTPESAPQLVGVPLPGRRRTHDSGRSAPHTVAGMLDPARQPQTLEELLERHWEQGSRFLMEQASHFDIASLLSSLHQLREENLGLEDSVDRLIARRDHLLAVRARLLALNSLTLGSLSQEARRDPPPIQNGPSQPDRRLVSPSRPLVSPSRDKALPSPRDRGAPPIPSPRERPGQPSPRDRDRSPRLPHHPMENGLDPAYRHDRVGGAQLLSVAHPSSNSNHRQHSPVSVPGPPKAHYSHNTSLPPGPPRHPELRGNYPSNYQMVSPPAPKGPVPGGAPLPAHSSHLPMVSRSTPPGVRNTPPSHGAPPSHHSLPPNMHPHMMRSSPQSTLHPKK